MHSRDYMKTNSSRFMTKLYNGDKNSTKETITNRNNLKDMLNSNTGVRKSFILSRAKSRIKNIRKKIFLNFFIRSKKAESVNIHKHEPLKDNYNTTKVIDFGCQSSLNSNCSMEIISQVLTRSMSQLSSSLDGSINFKLWRRNQPKQPRAIQVFAYYLMRKFKHSNPRITRRSKYNISVLGVSKILNKSSADTVLSNENVFESHAEYPIKIGDKPQNTKTVIRREKKHCRPGEILFKKT